MRYLFLLVLLFGCTSTASAHGWRSWHYRHGAYHGYYGYGYYGSGYYGSPVIYGPPAVYTTYGYYRSIAYFPTVALYYDPVWYNPVAVCGCPLIMPAASASATLLPATPTNPPASTLPARPSSSPPTSMPNTPPAAQPSSPSTLTPATPISPPATSPPASMPNSPPIAPTNPPPTSMLNPPKGTESERVDGRSPFSPIAPATMNSPTDKAPARPSFPEVPQPMPSVEQLPRPEFAPIQPVEPKIELPPLAGPRQENPPSRGESQPPRKDQPKLELPPLEPPVLPNATSMPNAKSISQYLGEPEVTLFPAAGSMLPNGRYRIDFFNATERTITLVVDGATMELPRHSRVSATVGRSFRWSLDGMAERRTTLAANTAGADVLIR